MKPRPEEQTPCDSSFAGGIICGQTWESYAIWDYLQSNLGRNKNHAILRFPAGGIICVPIWRSFELGFGSICGSPFAVQFGDHFWSGDHLRAGIISAICSAVQNKEKDVSVGPELKVLRVTFSKNQRNRGHRSKFNFAHTLSIGRPRSHTY